MRALDSFEASFPDLLREASRAARNVVRDAATTEDVAAETLHRVFQRWHSLDPDGRRAWTRRVARNLAIDHVRRRQPRVAPASVTDGPDAAVVDRVDLVAALAALPARQREAVAFRYFADLSEAEVATTLGVSLNTARTHLRRALASLRERMGPDADLILSTTRSTAMPTALRDSWPIVADAHPLGELVDRRTIRFERRFPVSTETIWEAIVGQLPNDEAPEWARAVDVGASSALGAWFIPIPSHLEPRLGGHFWFGAEDDKVMSGVVIDFDPERQLVLSFRNGSGASFQVTPTGDGSTVVYTHWLPVGFTLPQDRSDDGVDLGRTDNFAWNYQPGGPGSYQPSLAARRRVAGRHRLRRHRHLHAVPRAAKIGP